MRSCNSFRSVPAKASVSCKIHVATNPSTLRIPGEANTLRLSCNPVTPSSYSKTSIARLVISGILKPTSWRSLPNERVSGAGQPRPRRLTGLRNVRKVRPDPAHGRDTISEGRSTLLFLIVPLCAILTDFSFELFLFPWTRKSLNEV